VTKNNKVEEAISELQLTLKELNTENTKKIVISAEYIDTKLERIKSILLQEEEGVEVVGVHKIGITLMRGYCGKCSHIVTNFNDAKNCRNCGIKLIWKGE
jgi:hypothetical protein